MSAAAVVSKKKVTKVVMKSLESGGYMSASHVTLVLTDCLQLLREKPELCRTDDDDKNGLDQSYPQAIPSIVQMMKRWVDHANVQDLACAVLRDLAQDSNANRAAIAKHGGVQAVLMALLKHEHSMEVQVTGMAALANLSRHVETAQTILPEWNGLEVLKTCMDAYPQHADLQLQACRVIEATGKVPSNARALASLRISEPILHVLMEVTFVNNAVLYGQACAAIAALCQEMELHRQQLAPAIPCILEGMKAWPKDAAFQAPACRALWNLTRNHEENTKTLILYDAGKGVTIVLNSALKPHSNDATVQETACGILVNLTQDPDHAYTVGVLSGGIDKLIALILKAMRHHEAVKPVQAQACSVLCHLALVADDKQAILNAGGIGMIVLGMRESVDDVTVQKAACRALRHLALDSKQSQVSIAAAGGIGTLLGAMERHADNAGVQILALDALQHLLPQARNQTTMLRHSALKIIQAATRNFPDNAFIVQTGGAILAELKETLLSPN